MCSPLTCLTCLSFCMQVFNFGTVVADLSKGGEDSPGAGVRANVKITNTVKVPCTVNLSVAALTKLAQTDMAFPMTVDPQQLIIPAHEYRFASLVFHPRAILPFNATFSADVENGAGASCSFCVGTAAVHRCSAHLT